MELHTEININARPDKVWQVLTDFSDYPNWNPFIKSISGELIEGKNLSVHIFPPGGNDMKFSPVILKAEKNNELRWLGKVLISGLFDGEHIFELKDNRDGTTTFVQREQFKGILVPFFKKMLEKNTKSGFELMNQKLKEKAEQ